MQPPIKYPHLHFEKIWGGSRLPLMEDVDWKNRRTLPIGESWIFTHGAPLPLVKLIDTSDLLSVQVHPNDTWAKHWEGPHARGKWECWLILDAPTDGGVYLGLKATTTATQLRDCVMNSADPRDLLNFVPVRRGDLLVIPPGSVHAIGANIFLLEIQQHSELTYRLWDWNRGADTAAAHARPLHLEQALSCIQFDPHFNAQLRPTSGQRDLFHKIKPHHLPSPPEFSITLQPLDPPAILPIKPSCQQIVIPCTAPVTYAKAQMAPTQLSLFEAVWMSHGPVRFQSGQPNSDRVDWILTIDVPNH